jgi:hypothetical protein
MASTLHYSRKPMILTQSVPPRRSEWSLKLGSLPILVVGLARFWLSADALHQTPHPLPPRFKTRVEIVIVSRPSAHDAEGNEERSLAFQSHCALIKAERPGFFQQLPNPPAPSLANGGSEQSCAVRKKGVEVWFECALMLTAPPAP